MRPYAVLLITVLVFAVGCKPRVQEASPAPVPATEAAAPPSEQNNARMGSLYQDEFDGPWLVEPTYINLLCERTSSGDYALTATVDGTSYALNAAAEAQGRNDAGREALSKVFNAGIDPTAALTLLSERATGVCGNL